MTVAYRVFLSNKYRKLCYWDQRPRQRSGSEQKAKRRGDPIWVREFGWLEIYCVWWVTFVGIFYWLWDFVWYFIDFADAVLFQIHTENNALTGSLPSELGRLRSAEVLWMSKQKLAVYHIICKTIDIYTSYSSAYSIYLLLVLIEDQKLTGSIPTDLGKLKSLSQLSLGKCLNWSNEWWLS